MDLGCEAVIFSFTTGSVFTNIRRPSKFSAREICARVELAANPRVARMTAAGMAERLPITFLMPGCADPKTRQPTPWGRRQRIRVSLESIHCGQMNFSEARPDKPLRPRFWRSVKL